MITYESVCKKLGFKFDDEMVYRSDTPCFEDDSTDNPYAILSEAELDFIGTFLRNKQNLKTA
jgi:hypothetical protein